MRAVVWEAANSGDGCGAERMGEGEWTGCGDTAAAAEACSGVDGWDGAVWGFTAEAVQLDKATSVASECECEGECEWRAEAVLLSLEGDTAPCRGPAGGCSGLCACCCCCCCGECCESCQSRGRERLTGRWDGAGAGECDECSSEADDNAGEEGADEAGERELLLEPLRLVGATTAAAEAVGEQRVAGGGGDNATDVGWLGGHGGADTAVDSIDDRRGEERRGEERRGEGTAAVLLHTTQLNSLATAVDSSVSQPRRTRRDSSRGSAGRLESSTSAVSVVHSSGHARRC